MLWRDGTLLLTEELTNLVSGRLFALGGSRAQAEKIRKTLSALAPPLLMSDAPPRVIERFPASSILRTVDLVQRVATLEVFKAALEVRPLSADQAVALGKSLDWAKEQILAISPSDDALRANWRGGYMVARNQVPDLADPEARRQGLEDLASTAARLIFEREMRNLGRPIPQNVKALFNGTPGVSSPWWASARRTFDGVLAQDRSRAADWAVELAVRLARECTPAQPDEPNGPERAEPGKNCET